MTVLLHGFWGQPRDWNEVLGKVLVEGGTVEQVKTFYSCLYRMVFFPLRMYEKNASGKIVHYSPYNGNIEDGYIKRKEMERFIPIKKTDPMKLAD